MTELAAIIEQKKKKTKNKVDIKFSALDAFLE